MCNKYICTRSRTYQNVRQPHTYLVLRTLNKFNCSKLCMCGDATTAHLAALLFSALIVRQRKFFYTVLKIIFAHHLTGALSIHTHTIIILYSRQGVAMIFLLKFFEKYILSICMVIALCYLRHAGNMACIINRSLQHFKCE